MDVVFVGDVNGDGFGDFVIGLRDGVYIVLGQVGEVMVNFDVVVDGIGGYKVRFLLFFGLGNVFGGVMVFVFGDIDKDGFDDVVVGFNFGIFRIIYGFVMLGVLGNLVSLIIIVEGVVFWCDEMILFVDSVLVMILVFGDINGDGIDDFMVGVLLNVEGGVQVGVVYVVFGCEGGRSDIFLIDIVNGIGGFKIIGEVVGNVVGILVFVVGDLNGDGFIDLVIGVLVDRNFVFFQFGFVFFDDVVV